MSQSTRITVAHGDGIGPEIMEATLKILEAAGAGLAYDTIEIGEKVYAQGISSGISEESIEKIRQNKVVLKAPITTPQGGGYKSLNVTIRKMMGLYANVRPVKSFSPFVPSHFPQMDVVIVRENEEDVYAAIEHRQTQDVYQCLKLITRPGCEKISRYAFEYARMNNRKRVTCMTKDNIMKITDGLFHKVFDEIAAEYPDIENETRIIDIGSAKLANKPEMFDVIVTENLYGDIISDIAAEVAGSVGMCGSGNIGESVAMFEAIHGSAPDIAGQGLANPSGLLNGALQMLLHLGKTDVAEKIENAWLRTLEEGVHTGDIYSSSHSTQKVGTQEFAQAVIDRLGERPEQFAPASYQAVEPYKPKPYVRQKQEKQLIGVDLFIEWDGQNPDHLARGLQKLSDTGLEIKLITNRGAKTWPGGVSETFLTDHWRCRFRKPNTNDPDPIQPQTVLELQRRAIEAGHEVIKTENLYTFNETLGFSLGQGE